MGADKIEQKVLQQNSTIIRKVEIEKNIHIIFIDFKWKKLDKCSTTHLRTSSDDLPQKHEKEDVYVQ